MLFRKEIKLLFSSFTLLRTHPLLLVPDLILLFFSLFIALFSLYITGLIDIILVNPFVITSGGEFMSVTNFILGYFENSNNFLRLVVAFAVFVITHFFLGSSILALKYVMIQRIIANKDVNLVSCFRASAAYYWEVILLRILVFVITFIFPFVIGMSFFSNSLLLGIVLIVSLLVNAAISLVLLFRYPIMFLEREAAVPVIKRSFTFFKKKFNFVLLAALSVVILAIIFNVIMLALNALLPFFAQSLGDFFRQSLSTWAGALLLVAIIYFLRSIFGIIFALWQDVFLFRIYKLKEK